MQCHTHRVQGAGCRVQNCNGTNKECASYEAGCDPVHGREQWKLRAIEVFVIVPICFESSN